MKKQMLTRLSLTLFLILMFSLPAKPVTIILTSDQQLLALMDPDQKIDMSTGHNKRVMSLREVCETASAKGDKLLTIAFDEFFRQYREMAGTDRNFTPDQDEYIEKIKFINDFAAGYGMGLGLSLLSPLELGPSFIRQKGQGGRWYHYKVGYRDPRTGQFNVSLWRHLTWTNNKGKVSLDLKDVHAYAFREKQVGKSQFRAVTENDIRELSDVGYEEWSEQNFVPMGEEWGSTSTDQVANLTFNAKRIRVFPEGDAEGSKDPGGSEGFDRVLVVLEYEVPEMDYFHPEALSFLKDLMKKYHDKGINLQKLYSDELHIQQDWYYFNHQDNGQFAMRYYTHDMAEVYKGVYGEDFEPWKILYFNYGAPIYQATTTAIRNVQYVMGDDPEDIHRTFLFRDRYYKLMNNHVVDLFKSAKSYAEGLWDHEFQTGAHASWAESPTVDLWYTEQLEHDAYQYEYTPNFLWSNTVHQAAAACYDYFKWGEYLEPTGNDFAEIGYADRNYYGAAMATSIGVINKYPNAYAAYWGMPIPVRERKMATNSAFGARARESIKRITDNQHREVDVLILYPMNLVAVEERFGSWMTQYGYANYLSAEKFLELAEVRGNGSVQVMARNYKTIVALFEPLPAEGLLDALDNFATAGGNLLWFGPPPLLDGSGKNVSAQWEEIFHVDYNNDVYFGELAPGKIIDFENSLGWVQEQTILTDFLVDKIFPVEPKEGGEIVARCDGRILGVKSERGRGTTYFLGFRPRDDQSASLGYETRTLFDILDVTGAYPRTGTFIEFNDNTEFVSRTSDYLTTRFPNGSVVIANHYCTHRENWPDGFSRDEEFDAKLLAVNPLPSDRMNLSNMMVNGHDISYQGRLITAFRTDDAGRLVAFEGHDCTELFLDGKAYSFSSDPLETIVFNKPETGGGKLEIFIEGEGRVSIPLPGNGPFRLLDMDGKELKFKIKGENLLLDVDEQVSGKWLILK